MMPKIQGELIGKKIKITQSSNKSLLGIQGKVVEDTKNTIKIASGEKEKMIIKKQVKFSVLGDRAE